jgi:hypothetical protein
MRLKNWNCDNDKCRDPAGQIRVYPLGAGGNLLLCRACFEVENQYRRESGREYGAPERFPVVSWDRAVIYGAEGQ